jgi:hypothetical protein
VNAHDGSQSFADLLEALGRERVTRLLATSLGRLAVLSLVIAVVGRAIWAWQTSSSYLLPYQYFFTVDPENSYLQRDGRKFDINLEYDRSLLVTGPLPKPLGVDPDTNIHILNLGTDLGDAIEKANENMYSMYCGFIDDKVQRDRTMWRGVVLCNAGQLANEMLQVAVTVFHQKVDDEIWDYRVRIAKNAADKMSRALLSALAVVVIAAAGMWIVKGKVV